VAGTAHGLQRELAKLGDTPEYRFRGDVLNGQGISSLADLRGRPVLIDFWGTRCPPCVGFAVPKALKLQSIYGEDLVVLLVESQGASLSAMSAFALRKCWLGSGVVWTTERVFDLGLRNIPHSALLSPSGEIVIAGYTKDISVEIDEAIEQMVRESREGPPGTPAALAPAWLAMSAGKYAQALGLARRLADEASGPAAVAATEAMIEFTRRIERQIEQARWQLENGYPLEALIRLKALEQGLQGEPLWLSLVEDLRRDAGSRSSELAAAEDLLRIEVELFGKGPAPELVDALSLIEEEHRGTRVASRAQRLIELAELAADE
jgi:thiol-disulfide isomerase/thioredoxin